MSASAYFSDSRLLNRVREYLRAKKPDTPLPVHLVAEDLQTKYREYERRKKNAFRKMVERACSIVYEEDGINCEAQLKNHKSKKRKKERLEEDSESDSFSSENEDYMEYKDSNAMNCMMASIYRKTAKKQSDSQPSSRNTSAPDSPYHTDTGTQEPGLGRSLFVIDRSGDKQLCAQKMSKNKTRTLSNDIRPQKRHNENHGHNNTDIISENGDLLQCRTELVNSTLTSTMNLDADAIAAGDMTDAVSVKSEKSVKKGKKKSDAVKKKKLPEARKSTVTFADVGGNEKTIQEVCKLLVHMKHPEVYLQLGVTPPRGFLLHGPPGCGKTLLAHAIAGELDLPFMKLAATEIVSGVSGESEEKVRDIFEQAVNSSPCILFIDEIDAITQKRENASKDMERRIVAQLLTCMDDLNAKQDTQVIVIGATNREDSLDPALRRAGRFDREICMGIPDEKARMGILQVLCKDLRLSSGFDFLHLARSTPGFVGADLMALAREAAMTAVNRVFTESQASRNCNNSGVHEVSLRVHHSAKAASETEVAPNVTCASMDVSEDEKYIIKETQKTSVQRDGVINSVSSCDTNESENEPHPGNTSQTNTCTSSVMSGGKNAPNDHVHLSHEVLSVLDWLKDQPPLTPEQMSDLYITMDDFTRACKVVQPSAKREGFATIPDVTWEDIGALRHVREELEMAILAPVRHPEQFQALGITSPAGVLLAGPPGCGKTLLAKAVANESGLNFISVKGPELLNMYVGESERAVRQVFTRARNSAPCVIFFDELDALCPKRSGSSEAGSSARVVNQLLTEMDGLEERKQVFIMGATNRPDIIDPAVLRPGRLDKIIYVGLPNQQDRCDILRTLTKNGTKPELSDDVNLEEISQQPRCDSYTGADLAALVREASVLALKEFMNNPTKDNSETVSVSRKHFDLALEKIKPSVSAKDQEKYERMRQQFTVT